jgi:nickel-dependent lactate racemase
MEKVKLKYGNSEVELKIENAKSVKYLNEKEIKEIDDIEKEFYYSVNNCVNSPSLKDLIAPEDKVTVVISDLTRFWMRQDVIVSLLVKYLYELGVKYENIAILVGLGTHRPQTEDEIKTLVRAAGMGAVGRRAHQRPAPAIASVESCATRLRRCACPRPPWRPRVETRRAVRD